jgi:hypothetical protein
MQILRDLGYVPSLRSVMPRICPNGMESSETWIVDLKDRQPIVDDRVPAEVADKEKPLNAEVAGYRAYFGTKDK